MNSAVAFKFIFDISNKKLLIYKAPSKMLRKINV